LNIIGGLILLLLALKMVMGGGGGDYADRDISKESALSNVIVFEHITKK
jgi:small neutral amino acid transporter SnatA (MarC family)